MVVVGFKNVASISKGKEKMENYVILCYQSKAGQKQE